MALCIAGAIYLLQPKEIIYDLIVEAEVSMFKDEEYKIDVKLIDQEGNQYEGKYSFESTNTELVNVDDDWTLESWYLNENYPGKILTNNEVIEIENFVNYETGEKIIDTAYVLYTSNAYFMDVETLLYLIKIKY